MSLKSYSTSSSTLMTDPPADGVMPCLLLRRRRGGEGKIGQLYRQKRAGEIEETRTMLEKHRMNQKLVDGAIDLILDVGKPSFNSAYESYLRRFAGITQYMVVAYRRGQTEPPQMLMNSSADLAKLYRAVFYKQDPNRPVILDNAEDGTSFYFPALLNEHYSRTYRQSIFQSNGIIDKFGTACWTNDVCYYINYYRMHGEQSFTARDREQLLEVSDLISNLVARHFESLDKAGAARPALFEGNLERILKSLSPESPLTEREAQVCTLILMGCSSEAIALRLGIAMSSVLTYRRRAYMRLAIVSQNELFAMVLSRFSGEQPN